MYLSLTAIAALCVLGITVFRKSFPPRVYDTLVYIGCAVILADYIF